MHERPAADNASVQFDLSPAEALSRSIARLPEEQRVVLCLFHLEGLSLEEIAVVTDLAEEEVAALFYEASAGVGVCPSPSELLAAA